MHLTGEEHRKVGAMEDNAIPFTTEPLSTLIASSITSPALQTVTSSEPATAKETATGSETATANETVTTKETEIMKVEQKRARQDCSHDGQQVKPEESCYKMMDSDTEITQAQSTNQTRTIDLTTVEDRPMLYNVNPPQVTEPILPWKLPDAFSEIPFVEFTQSKEEHKAAQRRQINEFVGDNLTSEQFERLEMYCSPDNLRLGNELKITRQNERDFGFDYMDVTEYGGNKEPTGEAEKLHTSKKYKLRLEMDENNIYPRKLKYRGLRYMPLQNEFQPVTPPDEALIPGKDILFRIRMYRPFDYNPRSCNAWSLPSISRCPIFTGDLILTGRHTLYAIRDAISCINENNLRVDISESHNKKPPVTCKTLFPSGFLFINNAFYNDQRANCKDLSAPLVEWARKHNVGDFPTWSMDTRLDTITIKLGYPDVYVHQGDCEHTFSFSDVRLVTAADPLNLSAYPTQTFLSKSHEAYCTTCADKIATRLVAECDRVPFDPAFMCDTCFDLYLYDKNGKKKCDFIAYDYVKE